MSHPDPISVLLVDDHPLVTEGLAACLKEQGRFTISATAISGAAAIEQYERHAPDVVLMDINLPDMTGLEATRKIIARHSNARIIILSMHDNREYVLKALDYGACGYLLKDVSSREIATAIKAIHRGGTYFSKDVFKAVAAAPDQPRQITPLTSRETEIITELSRGATNRQIAQTLAISERTVETHRKNIKRKLKITTTAGLTRFAIEHDLL